MSFSGNLEEIQWHLKVTKSFILAYFIDIIFINDWITECKCAKETILEIEGWG